MKLNGPREASEKGGRRTVDVGGVLDNAGLSALVLPVGTHFVFAFKLHRASGCLRLSL